MQDRDNPRARGGYGSSRDIVLFLAPGLGAYALIMLYPNLTPLWYSLTEWRGHGPPQCIGLANFSRMWSDPALLIALGMIVRSLFLALFVTVPLAFGLALLLSRKARGSRFYRFS